MKVRRRLPSFAQYVKFVQDTASKGGHRLTKGAYGHKFTGRYWLASCCICGALGIVEHGEAGDLCRGGGVMQFSCEATVKRKLRRQALTAARREQT